MSNVVDDADLCLVERCLGNVPRVVVWAGRLVEDGKPEEQWRQSFLIDVVGSDIGDVGLGDHDTHAEAMACAREISIDWGNLPIVDRTLGGTLL